MFDFTKYYKNMSATTDTKIDIKDIPIKSSSSTSATDEEGNPYDASLNEIVTKNIDYIVTDINTSAIDNYYMTDAFGYPLFDGSSSEKKNNKLIQATLLNNENTDKAELDKGAEKESYSFRIASSLDNAEYALMKPDGSEIGSFNVNVPYKINNVTNYKPATITVTPKHKLLKTTDPIPGNANLYVHSLAMFGLLGSSCENLLWATDKDRWSYKNIIMSYKTLGNRLNRAQKKMAEQQFEVETTTYYDLTDPNSNSDKDITSCGLLQWRGANSTEALAYGDLNGFCKKMKEYKYMIDCEGENSTPFLPSLRDAFTAYYYPKDDLCDDFNDEFDRVIRQIKKLWRFKNKLKKSTRAKIQRVCATDWKTANADEIAHTDSELNDCKQYLIDIESCMCISNNHGKLALPTLLSPIYGSYDTVRFRTTAYDGLTGVDGNTFNYYAQVPVAAHKYTPVVYDGNIGYPWFVSYDDIKKYYDNSNPTNVKFDYTEMSLSELNDIMEDMWDSYIIPTLREKFTNLSVNEQGHLRENYISQCLNIALDSLRLNMIPPTAVNEAWIPQIAIGDPTSNTRMAFIEAFEEQYPDQKLRIVNWVKGASLKEIDSESNSYYGSTECTGKTEYRYMVPGLMENSDTAGAHVCDKISIIDDIDDIIERFNTAIIAIALLVSPITALILKLLLRKLEDAVSDFKRVVRRIQYFEYYTADSVFPSKERILKDSQCYHVSKGIPITALYPARFLVPTRLYKKIKVKKRILCFTRTYTKKVCVGTRWTEVRFINVGLYDRYPKDMYVPRNKITYVTNYSISANLIKVEKEIPTEIDNGDTVGLKLNGVANEVSCKVIDRYTFEIPSDVEIPTQKSGTTEYIMTDLPKTKPGDDASTVQIEYKLPYLPYDEEIRGYAFGKYGPLDQSKYAIINRGGSSEIGHDGWQIFHDSSADLKDLRKGINIYPTVANLIKILKDNFGANRVVLCETTRSVDDQKKRCLGGNESAFLSWHNYGLAVKIQIYGEDGLTPITDDGDDMRKLIDIAEQFTNDCLKGKYGAQFNVVWCGRLRVGANIFVWEFLPIGVGHKDAPLFRDSYIAQRDPIMDLGFVKASKYAIDSSQISSYNSQKKPWISTQSTPYKNAIIINGEKFIAPKYIKNYQLPKNLPLINVIEFFNLIQLKMDAYGTKMPNKGDMYEWLNKNKKSYEQLLMYFGMLGNLNAFRALLAGEYISRFKPVVNNYYSTDSIEFVKQFLGEHYYTAQIRISDSKDASYISLCDGRLHIPCADGRPYLPLSDDNLFDQKRVTKENYQRGKWVNGLFYPATKDDDFVSPGSVLQGYMDFQAVGGDAYIIHAYIADQIKEEFDKIVKMFESYNGDLLFDSFTNGPFAAQAEQLENEFGLIVAQDLLDFDHLRNMLTISDLMSNNGDGGNNGIAPPNSSNRENDNTYDQNIYEKVVSNAQVSGMRLAALSKEHLEINPLQSESITVEDVFRILQNGNTISANDIMK